jgi:ketosteroid isomerase-like protein
LSRAALALAALTLPGGQAIAVDMPTAEQEVTALIDRWVEAEIHHDRATLEEIIDPAALFTYRSRKTIGREDFIEMIMNADIAPFSVNHKKVLVNGDTAVSIDSEGETKFTSVMVRRDGRWRVISETFSNFVKPEAPPES